MLQQEARVSELRKFFEELYNSTGRKESLKQLNDDELLRNGAQPLDGHSVCHAGV